MYGVYGNFEVHSSFLIRRRIDPVSYTHLDVYKRQALQNGAAALRYGSLIDLFGFLHADGRIVDALDNTLRVFFQQPSDIRTAAAAAVQPLGVRRSIQKLKGETIKKKRSKLIHRRLSSITPKGKL